MAFLSCEEMLAAARSQKITLAEAVLRSDLEESRLTEAHSRAAMRHLWQVMQATSQEYDPAQRSRSGLSGGDAAKVEQAHQTELAQPEGQTDALDISSRNLSRYVAKFGPYPAWRDTAAHYFSCGEEMYPQLLADLDKAEKFIFLEFFILRSGKMWDGVEQILRRCTACGTLLVVDECFLDFLPDHALHTAKGLLREGDLVILKAFTKLYGMAGVRLGYALSADTALLEQMQACGQPWGVSSLAQAAGLAALEETAYAVSYTHLTLPTTSRV